MQFRLVKIFLLDFYFLNRFLSNSLSSSIKNLVSTESAIHMLTRYVFSCPRYIVYTFMSTISF
jgi:hypothetical protein